MQAARRPRPCPAVMNSQTRQGRRLALRFALVQFGVACLVALLWRLLDGGDTARSALTGGVIAATGTLVFAWRMFAAGWPATQSARGLYLGELLKWIWVIGALWLALTRGAMEPLPLLVGFMLAQVGFWVAVGLCRTG